MRILKLKGPWARSYDWHPLISAIFPRLFNRDPEQGWKRCWQAWHAFSDPEHGRSVRVPRALGRIRFRALGRVRFGGSRGAALNGSSPGVNRGCIGWQRSALLARGCRACLRDSGVGLRVCLFKVSVSASLMSSAGFCHGFGRRRSSRKAAKPLPSPVAGEKL